MCEIYVGHADMQVHVCFSKVQKAKANSMIAWVVRAGSKRPVTAGGRQARANGRVQRTV